LLKFYYPNGKQEGIEEYKDGFFYKYSYFDTNGNLIGEDTIGYPYGNLVINTANGKPKINYKYLNGKKDGKQISYWLNGNYKNVEEYKDGRQINFEYNYYTNGKIKSKLKYTDGERDSVWNSYYEDGILENSENYLYDESTGEEKYFHENGKISWKGVNKDGQREGWFSYYSSDGNLQQKILYHLGIELAYSYLDKSGKAIDSIPFKLASGDFNSLFQNGNPSTKGSFVHGQRHGLYTRYYGNGKKEFECTFKYGLYDGYTRLLR